MCSFGLEFCVVIAVYARTLQPGVSLDDFIAAWMPERDDPYPARLEVAVDPSDDRRVITVVRFDGTLEELRNAMPSLVHPESLDRLAKIVETTELESVYSLAFTGT
jgi:hypothetical protein